MPKSVTLQASCSPTSTFRAARSRCTIFKQKTKTEHSKTDRCCSWNPHVPSFTDITSSCFFLRYTPRTPHIFPATSCKPLAFVLPSLKTGISSHQPPATRTSSAAVTSGWSWASHPGPCSRCRSVRGSSSGNPASLHTGHTRWSPWGGLQTRTGRHLVYFHLCPANRCIFWGSLQIYLQMPLRYVILHRNDEFIRAGLDAAYLKSLSKATRACIVLTFTLIPRQIESDCMWLIVACIIL